MSEQPTVVELIGKVMADVTAISKSDTNKHFGFSFRGIDTVLNDVAPKLREHGVIVHPELRDLKHFPLGKDGSKVIVTVAYVFTGPAGDTLTAVVPGEANDQQDKATSKAMSVAFRTALLQALSIPTNERDPHAGPAMSRKMAALMGELETVAGEKGFNSWGQVRDDYALWSKGADLEAATEKDVTDYLKHLDPSRTTTMQRRRPS